MPVFVGTEKSDGTFEAFNFSNLPIFPDEVHKRNNVTNQFVAEMRF